MKRELFIADIDNARNKVDLMTRLLTEALDGKSTADIVSALTAHMSRDELEDATVAICGVIR